MVSPGGRGGDAWGGTWSREGGFTSKASVFSVKWDAKFSAKSQGEKGYGGLAEG